MAADSGVETCASPEVADSRKRPLDHRPDGPADVKRSHFSSGEFVRIDSRSIVREGIGTETGSGPG